MASKREKREVRKANIDAWAEKEDRTFEPTSVKLPDGVNFWSPKNTGKYLIDIIPYVVEGDGNPDANDCEEFHCRVYMAHRGFGPGGKNTYVCTAQTANAKGKTRRCGFCDWLAKECGDPEMQKRGSPKTRALYKVKDLSTQDKKTKIWDCTYNKNFPEILKRQVGMVHDYRRFSDLKRGYTLQLLVEQQQGGSFTYNATSAVAFIPRDHKYTEKDRDDGICLDKLLVFLPYEEQLKICRGELDEEDEEVSRNGRVDEEDKEEDEDDTDEDEDEEEEEAPRKKQAAKKGGGKSGKPPVDDDEDEEEEDEDEEEEDEEEEDDDPPAARGRSTSAGKPQSKKASASDDEDEDEEEDEEEDTPAKTAKELGIKVGTRVSYKGVECEVRKVSKDGTSLVLEDEEEQEYRAVSPSAVKIITDDDDEDDEDDAPPARKPAAKAPPKGKGKGKK